MYRIELESPMKTKIPTHGDFLEHDIDKDLPSTITISVPYEQLKEVGNKVIEMMKEYENL